MRQVFQVLLLSGVAALSLAPSAKAAPVADPRLQQLEQEISDLKVQLDQLKQDGDYSGPLADLKRSSSDQYADITNRLDSAPRATVDNGRLTITSADGRFSTSLRALFQYDTGYFSQSKAPAAVDLSSGSNFRRAQIGLTGIAFGDWSYNFIYDFGGNGVEKAGYIYSAYVEYDGFKPFGVRIGAYAPPAGIEDSTGSADLIFPERPASVDIARNIAGAPSRDSITLFNQGDTYLAAVSYTGGKAADAATFDEQQAVVGRLAWLAVSDGNFHWLLDADGTHVFKLADSAPGYNPTPPSFSNGAEVGFDASKTVNSGTFNANHVTEYGFETAANLGSLYAQGGWFGYDVARRLSALPDPSFNGWYALATWTLTGEAKRYDPTTASFRAPKTSAALGSGGIGAWELAARYSDIDLNDHPFTAAAAGGISGGHQDTWSVGVNWYPNDIVRFGLDYQNIRVSHPNATAGNIDADALILRAQVAI